MPKSQRVLTTATLFMCGLLTNRLAVNAQGLTLAERYKAAQAHVAQLEHQLEKQLGLERRGFASGADVDEVRANLFKSQHDLAALQGDRKTMVEYDSALFEVRKRELKRHEVLKTRGHKSRFQLTEAQRRVAVCSYLVADNEGKKADVARALREAVQLCELEAELWKSAVANRFAARVELSLVLNRLVCGRNLLARETGGPDEIVKQLQSAVDLLQGDFEAVKNLRERGASTIFEELFSQANLLNAKARLANAQNQTDVVRQHVSALVKTNERLLVILKKPSSLTHMPHNLRNVLRTGIAKDLERDRRRLRALSLGLKIHDDLSIATLDP